MLQRGTLWLEDGRAVAGGRVVFGSGDFADLAPPPPPVAPAWSPVAVFGGHWRAATDAPAPATVERACHDACAAACGLHGHSHQIAWTAPIPTDDKAGFWGALGCSCFAV